MCCAELVEMQHISCAPACVQCPAGFSCSGSSAPAILCAAAGFYCPGRAPAPTAFPCAEGRFGTSARASVYAAADCEGACADDGRWCPSGSNESKALCAAGFYGTAATSSVSRSAQCEGPCVCARGWYCPSGSAAPTGQMVRGARRAPGVRLISAAAAAAAAAAAVVVSRGCVLRWGCRGQSRVHERGVLVSAGVVLASRHDVRGRGLRHECGRGELPRVDLRRDLCGRRVARVRDVRVPRAHAQGWRRVLARGRAALVWCGLHGRSHGDRVLCQRLHGHRDVLIL